MKLMTSKFPGTCRDCGAGIKRGETIGYHGKGAGVSCSNCAENAYEHDQYQRNPDKKSTGGDYSDMAYEDACAAACGPGL